MMKNKYIKIISIAVILIAIFNIFSVVFASDFKFTPKEDFSPDTKSSAAGAARDIVQSILGYLQIISGAIAIIMLVVLAIKYISAAPNDKAEIKKHAVVYVVGAVCLFGAAGILGVVKNFGMSLNDGGATSNPTGR